MMGQQANSSTEKKQLLTRGFTSINSTEEEELKRWEQSAINEIINAVAAHLDKHRQQQK
jgi:4-hydroxyphenylpyruvate dioxygenase-like putative hemolysin